MNKKIILAAVVLLGLGVSKVQAFSETLSSAWTITEVSASSAQVFSDGGYVKALYLSSGPAGSNNYVVLVDTDAPDGVTGFNTFPSASKKSPALVFSTNSASTDRWFTVFDYEDPIFLKEGAFVFKSATNSGEAIKAFLKWKK